MSPSSTEPLVGILGLGLLGAALAERLISAGYSVTGWDLSPERRQLAGSLGIRIEAIPPRPAAAAQSEASNRQPPIYNQDALIVCLPDGPSVRLAFLDDRLVHALRPGTVVIDCTTCAPAESRHLADALAERNIDFLDAPVSGNSAQVRRGEAVLLIGGDPTVLERCAPILSALSPKLRHLGPVGAGSTAKLVSNLVLGLNRLVLAEGMALGERAGLDPALLLETLRDSPAYSVAMDVKGERMVHRRYTNPEARLRQHEKDVGLLLALAEKLGIELPLSRLHAEILARASSLGFAEADNSAVLEVFRNGPG